MKEKEKILVTSIFSIFHIDFKNFDDLGCYHWGLCGKGLGHQVTIPNLFNGYNPLPDNIVNLYFSSYQRSFDYCDSMNEIQKALGV